MTNWTETATNTASYTDGVVSDEGYDAFELMIDGTYELLIDGTYSLLAQGFESGTIWTEVTAN